jgi:RND family efflux transporter MFP subunit
MSGKRLPKGVLPVLIVILGILGAVLLIKFKPEPPRRPVVNVRPLVKTFTVTDEVPSVKVLGYGEVNALRRVNLVARVAGAVEFKSGKMQDGAVFAEGDTLLVIETADYLLAVDMAAAQVASAEYNLARAEQEADIARREWNQTNSGDTRARPNPLVLHAPQLKLARANLASAQASYKQARLNLQRCLVTAPFAGRVIQESVDEGQYLAPGAAIGSIYAIDQMEVVVQVDDRELSLFDYPLCSGTDAAATVDISSDFSGSVHHWPGRVLRTAGAVDRQSRMVSVFIGVENSYHERTDRPVLIDGMFVNVEIAGHEYPEAVGIPRAALHTGDTVWVVDQDGILSIRTVDVIHKDSKQAILGAGLAVGEMIVSSQLDVVTEDMQVRIGGQKSDGAAKPAEVSASE